jgi:hypothetical protein
MRCAVAAQVVDVVALDEGLARRGYSVLGAGDVVTQERSVSEDGVVGAAESVDLAVLEREADRAVHDADCMETAGCNSGILYGDVVGVDDHVAPDVQGVDDGPVSRDVEGT